MIVMAIMLMNDPDPVTQRFTFHAAICPGILFSIEGMVPAGDRSRADCSQPTPGGDVRGRILIKTIHILYEIHSIKLLTNTP
ncbi:hypothetical protein HCU01_28530 [Halomonas cupida]|uniref:Uncharacterized protein n=1 Tax=Halomonas cupida TaxID=44933 RepID=A0ABQ0WM35_9GAMM|nr:hypothetical protein [Halomonas cupida]GEN24904.1 hypothetical protein HCU01_28530 [Halomonas cupida]